MRRLVENGGAASASIEAAQSARGHSMCCENPAKKARGLLFLLIWLRSAPPPTTTPTVRQSTSTNPPFPSSAVHRRRAASRRPYEVPLHLVYPRHRLGASVGDCVDGAEFFNARARRSSSRVWAVHKTKQHLGSGNGEHRRACRWTGGRLVSCRSETLRWPC